MILWKIKAKQLNEKAVEIFKKFVKLDENVNKATEEFKLYKPTLTTPETRIKKSNLENAVRLAEYERETKNAVLDKELRDYCKQMKEDLVKALDEKYSVRIDDLKESNLHLDLLSAADLGKLYYQAENYTDKELIYRQIKKIIKDVDHGNGKDILLHVIDEHENIVDSQIREFDTFVNMVMLVVNNHYNIPYWDELSTPIFEE